MIKEAGEIFGRIFGENGRKNDQLGLALRTKALELVEFVFMVGEETGINRRIVRSVDMRGNLFEVEVYGGFPPDGQTVFISMLEPSKLLLLSLMEKSDKSLVVYFYDRGGRKVSGRPAKQTRDRLGVFLNSRVVRAD